MSSFKNKNSQALIATASNAVAVIGTSGTGPYHVEKETMIALESLNTTLQTAQEAQANLRLAEKASTVTKLARMDDVSQALTLLQAKVAGDDTVTDSMLAALGFSRRSSGKSQPKIPSAPTDLTVVPNADGTAKLRWKKGTTTPVSTSFLVEQSDDGINFRIVDSTGRVSYTATDVAPGVTAYFRVTATTSMGRSGPSATVGMYLPGASARPTLKLAA